ncbi:hypothetical protein HZS_219 [Henneguya salminicola]|nr:hypothetical protein HZS_219 [Henneguya salminicola]
MAGEKIFTPSYGVAIMTVFHNDENKFYVIYLFGFGSKYELNQRYSGSYFIRKNDIFFAEEFFYYNHITHGEFYLILKTSNF